MTIVLVIVGVVVGLVLLFLWGLDKASSEESKAEERWSEQWRR